MYSKAYVRKKLVGPRSRIAGFYRANILGAVVFLLISVLVAPIIHEMMHFAVLELYHCYYEPGVEFSFDSGLYGNIRILCALSPGKEALVFGAGLLVNYVIAAILFMLVRLIYHRGQVIHAAFFMYAALGFLSDPIFYFFASSGDMISILSLIRREEWIPLLPLLGVSLLSLAVAFFYRYMERFLEDYMRIEKEVAEAEAFIEQIR